MNGLDHPAVRAWLARLDTEAAVLPADRRAEVRADVEEILAAAAAESPTGDGAAEADAADAAVARALAELGDPADVVAEAGGYAVPLALTDRAPGDVVAAEPATAWLEVTTLTVLAASVVLALVPATEPFAPLPWFVGTILVLLSRRWSAGDKALAVLAFGVLGVPLLLLGRDELPTTASLVVSVLLVALWLGAAVRLLLRARTPREQGRGLRMR